jgi:hypothetical protein
MREFDDELGTLSYLFRVSLIFLITLKQNTYQDVEVDLLPTSVTDVDYNNHEENAADLSYSFNVQSENSSYEENQDQEGERTGSYRLVLA